MTDHTIFREKVLSLVQEERTRQDRMHTGNNQLTLGFGSTVSPLWLLPWTLEDSTRIEMALRADYEEFENLHGQPTWMHLIREEVAELFDTRVISDTIEEAVQVAALCVCLCEHLLSKGRSTVSVQSQDPKPFQIRDMNRALLYRAYDDGDGNTLTLEDGHDAGWFVGTYDGQRVMEGVEVDGMLYSICAQSGGGQVAVLVGRELIDNEIGVTFHSSAEARAYVLGLTAR